MSLQHRKTPTNAVQADRIGAREGRWRDMRSNGREASLTATRSQTNASINADSVWSASNIAIVEVYTVDTW